MSMKFKYCACDSHFHIASISLKKKKGKKIIMTAKQKMNSFLRC